MVEKINFIQKQIEQLIRVLIPSHPIDIGKFTTKTLEDLIKSVKNEIGFDFEEVRVYPGAQPKESSDIELIKNGEIVAKINLKTAVSGDIKVALRKLAKSIKGKEIGAVAFFALFYKDNDNVDVKMVIALIPGETFDYYEIPDIYSAIQAKIDEKIRKERYVKVETLAVNEAIEFLRAYESIITREMVEKSKEEIRMFRMEIKEVKEETKKVRMEIKEIKEEMRSNNENLMKIYGVLREILKHIKGGEERN